MVDPSPWIINKEIDLMYSRYGRYYISSFLKSSDNEYVLDKNLESQKADDE